MSVRTVGHCLHENVCKIPVCHNSPKCEYFSLKANKIVRYEHVYCPQCGSILSGMIISKQVNPFDIYDAYCPDCDYFVTESEWETVDEYKKLLDGKAAQDVRQ